MEKKQDAQIDISKPGKTGSNQGKETSSGIKKDFSNLVDMPEPVENFLGFIGSTVASLAQLGRSSEMLDISAKRLQAWQAAASAFGGSAEGLTNTMQSMASGLNNLGDEGGKNKFALALKEININANDSNDKLKSTEQLLLDVAGALDSMKPQQAKKFADMLGIDASILPLLMQGQNAVAQLVAEMENSSKVTDESTGKAQEFAVKLAQIEQKWNGVKTDLFIALVPHIEKALVMLEQLVTWLSAHQKEINGIFTFIATNAEKLISAVGGIENAFMLLLAYIGTKWVVGMIKSIRDVFDFLDIFDKDKGSSKGKKKNKPRRSGGGRKGRAKILKPAWDIATKLGKSLFDGAKTTAKVAFEGLKTGTKAIGSGIGKAVTWVAEGVRKVPGAVGRVASTTFNKVIRPIGTGAVNAYEWVKGGVSRLPAAAGQVYEKVSSVAKHVPKVLTRLAPLVRVGSMANPVLFALTAAVELEPYIDKGLNSLFGKYDYFQNIRQASSFGDFGSAIIGKGTGYHDANGNWKPNKNAGKNSSDAESGEDIIYVYPSTVENNSPVQKAQSVKRKNGSSLTSLDPYLGQLEYKYNLPPGLLQSVAMTESSGNSAAIGRETKYGTAKGLFQFIDSTAKSMGLTGNDVFDPVRSAEAAARYLNMLMNQFGGSLEKALAAYNWGSGNLSRLGLEKAPKETQNYIDKIIKGMPLGAEASIERYGNTINRQSNINNSDVKIGQITVHTPATDGEGIANDLALAINRNGLVTSSDAGIG